MKLDLYRVDKEYELLFSLIEEHGFTDEIGSRLNDTLQEFNTTALNIGAHYKNIYAKIALMKQYENDMAQKRKKLEAEAEKFEEFLKSNMLRFGVNKIEGPEITVSVKRTKSKLEVYQIFDFAEIKEKHIRTKTTQELDKEAIRNDIEAGEDVPYAQLVDNYSLRIK